MHKTEKDLLIKSNELNIIVTISLTIKLNVSYIFFYCLWRVTTGVKGDILMQMPAVTVKIDPIPFQLVFIFISNRFNVFFCILRIRCNISRFGFKLDQIARIH